jgi:hypothetical protein
VVDLIRIRTLADAGARRPTYLACDEALEWAPDDPRLPGLAAAITEWDAGKPRRRNSGAGKPPAEELRPGMLALMKSRVIEASRAWQRLLVLLNAPAVL